MDGFMFSLNTTTKRNIEQCVSLSFSDLIAIDYDDEHHLIRPVNGRKIVFPTKRDSRRIGRGSPFLARRRFRTIEEVDKKLMEICNANTE